MTPYLIEQKKVQVGDEWYIETIESWGEGQSAKWTRYGPIPFSMLDEVWKDVADVVARFWYAQLFSVQHGMIFPASTEVFIPEGKSIVETLSDE